MRGIAAVAGPLVLWHRLGDHSWRTKVIVCYKGQSMRSLLLSIKIQCIRSRQQDLCSKWLTSPGMHATGWMSKLGRFQLIIWDYGLITCHVHSVILPVEVKCLQMKVHSQVLGQGQGTVGSNGTYLFKHVAPVKKKQKWRNMHDHI